MEYSLHTDSVGVLFTTTGPGLTNTYTGLRTARTDGAKIVLLSGLTSESEVGNPRPIQETTAGWIDSATNESFQYPFSESIILRHRGDLVHLAQRLRALNDAPAGGCLGVFVSLATQKTLTPPLCSLEITPPVRTQRDAGSLHRWTEYLSTKLQSGNCIIWAGSGAKAAASDLRKVAEHYDTPVVTTLRAKGVFPETHELSLGCTGTWGNVTTDVFRSRLNPNTTVIVLGSRLQGLCSSLIQLHCMSECELIAVDLHPGPVRRNLPPHALVIEAEIKSLLNLLAQNIHNTGTKTNNPKYKLKEYSIPREESKQKDRIHPTSLISMVQSIAIDTYDYKVIVDNGNTLAWTTSLLRFSKVGRFRASTHEAPMGQAACGAVGIGACGTPVLAIVGDGAMLLQNEISTAVSHQLPVIWLVLNDALYNMCQQGMDELGACVPDCSIPETDFALYGRSLGARGFVAKTSSELEDSLWQALEEKVPTVIDARIDSSVVAPLGDRVTSLARE
ncbi:thiamine diphosphate-binding protein [Aspergillus avenaceus]|uniref:Thiamine diphosphate-binding protein n=1 Tax=Aspergillus avenaceus TaxID=36643 RepID=A0A5N6TY54_ASPAV|nr:thiamine diphosphate-binding protein [Aspergillus avenaceus]